MNEKLLPCPFCGGEAMAIFCGEWSYGITMVPCSFAVQLAEMLLDVVGDIEVGLDIERDVSESDSEDDGCTFTEFAA